MSESEAILVLLAATTALVALARKLNIPYPILLVIGGLALGFVPGLPQVELDPDLLFVLILPADFAIGRVFALRFAIFARNCGQFSRWRSVSSCSRPAQLRSLRTQ